MVYPCELNDENMLVSFLRPSKLFVVHEYKCHDGGHMPRNKRLQLFPPKILILTLIRKLDDTLHSIQSNRNYYNLNLENKIKFAPYKHPTDRKTNRTVHKDFEAC